MSGTNPASSSTSGSTTTSTPSYGTNEYVINGTLDLPQTAPSNEQFLAIQPDGTVVASGSNASSFATPSSTGSFSPTITFFTNNSEFPQPYVFYTEQLYGFATVYTLPSASDFNTLGDYTATTTAVSTPSGGAVNSLLNFSIPLGIGISGVFYTVGSVVDFSLQFPIIVEQYNSFYGQMIGFQFDLPYLPNGYSVSAYTFNLSVAGTQFQSGVSASPGYYLPNYFGLVGPLAFLQNNSSPTVTFPGFMLFTDADGKSGGGLNDVAVFMLTVTGKYVISN